MSTEQASTYIKVADIAVVAPIEGNPYAANPIRFGQTLAYLKDPSNVSLAKQDNHTSGQVGAFFEPQGDDQRTSNIFAINILLPNGEYSLNDRVYRKTIDVVGRMDEVQPGPTPESGDSVVRIRKSGEPSTYDAFSLGISNLVYQRQESGKPAPLLLLIRSSDGKKYQLKVLPHFYRNLLNAILFASLAKKAGYVPDQKGNQIAKLNVDLARKREKRVFYKNKKGRQSLTASEAFNKARALILEASGQFSFDEVG